MPAEQVPIVLVPRYTTFAGLVTGGEGFTTVPLDVTAYDAATLIVWRGVVIDAPPPPDPPPDPPPPDPIEIVFEESTDRDTWSPCASTGGTDPGENTQLEVGVTLAKRWFRVRITLEQPEYVASVWIAGSVQKRQR